MKTNGSEWSEYLDSWPDGQWMDSTEITVNGKPDENVEEIYPTDIVEVTAGEVYNAENEFVGTLARHFSRWKKAQKMGTVIVSIPKENAQLLKDFLNTVGGKEIK